MPAGPREAFFNYRYERLEIGRADQDCRRPTITGDRHPIVLARNAFDDLREPVLDVGEGEGFHGYNYSQIGRGGGI